MPKAGRAISRREFLEVTAAGACGLALQQSAFAAPSKKTKKPNILWIMSDEHNHNVAGCYGNRVVHTPHIDSLSQKGITFDTHYCNSPLCVPSRLSLTAGKYTSRVDVWGLTCELPSADIPTLPRVLNSAGYTSYLCGKQHYDYSRRYGFTEVGGNFNHFHPGDHGSTVEHDRRVTAGAVDFLSKRQPQDEPFFLYTGYLAPHFP